MSTLEISVEEDENITPRSFDALMSNYLALEVDEMTPGDSYLIMMLCRNAEALEEHWDACLPEWEADDPRWATDEAAEIHGPAFHKGFRQVDVCSVPGDDKRIHTCLAEGGNLIPVGDNFWDMHAKTLRGEIDLPDL